MLQIYTWGSGYQGQLGQGKNRVSKVPGYIDWFNEECITIQRMSTVRLILKNASGQNFIIASDAMRGFYWRKRSETFIRTNANYLMLIYSGR